MKYWIKPGPVSFSPPQVLHDLGSNPGRCSGESTTNRLRITVMVLNVHFEAKSSSESVNIYFDIKIFVNSFRYQVLTGVRKF
jgi:hypothetical protein